MPGPLDILAEDTLSALLAENFQGGRPSLFLLKICARLQFCTDTDWEILIPKLCKFNSKHHNDLYVHCIKAL